MFFVLIIYTVAPSPGIIPAPWGPDVVSNWETIGVTVLEEKVTGLVKWVGELNVPSVHLYALVIVSPASALLVIATLKIVISAAWGHPVKISIVSLVVLSWVILITTSDAVTLFLLKLKVPLE